MFGFVLRAERDDGREKPRRLGKKYAHGETRGVSPENDGQATYHKERAKLSTLRIICGFQRRSGWSVSATTLRWNPERRQKKIRAEAEASTRMVKFTRLFGLVPLPHPALAGVLKHLWAQEIRLRRIRERAVVEHREVLPIVASQGWLLAMLIGCRHGPPRRPCEPSRWAGARSHGWPGTA